MAAAQGFLSKPAKLPKQWNFRSSIRVSNSLGPLDMSGLRFWVQVVCKDRQQMTQFTTSRQPRLHEWSVYHSSHPDVARNGWRKWSAERPDWYAWKSSSTHPDWYRRRVNTIRRADYKNINWAYEYPSKPTSRINDGFISVTNEVMQKDTLKPIPHNHAYQGCNTFPKPDPIPKEVPVPKWGLYHPPNYEEPIRYNHFPPIKYDGYK